MFGKLWTLAKTAAWTALSSCRYWRLRSSRDRRVSHLCLRPGISNLLASPCSVTHAKAQVDIVDDPSSVVQASMLEFQRGKVRGAQDRT